MSANAIDYDELHKAMVELTGLLNRPQPDAFLLRQAGVSLDRALFPILSRVGMHGRITIDELADSVGRDQSTVSRQVAKLEQLGLVTRRVAATDHRRREVEATEEGRDVLSVIGKARNEVLGLVLQDWSGEEQAELIRVMGRFVGSLRQRVDEEVAVSSLPQITHPRPLSRKRKRGV